MEVTVLSNLDKDNAALLKRPDLSPTTGVKISQVFLNVDLRNAHDGLLEIAHKGGINVRKFPRGNGLVFINEFGNRFKWMIPVNHDEQGNVQDWAILYYRCPSGRLNLKTLYDLPRLFAGSRANPQLQLAEAGQEALHEKLRPKRIRHITSR